MSLEQEFRQVLINLELLSSGTCQSWNKSSPPAELDRSPAGFDKNGNFVGEQPPHLKYRWRWNAETDDAGRAVVLAEAEEELRAWKVRAAPLEEVEFDWVAEVLGMVGLTPKEVCARCNGIVSERSVIRWRNAEGVDPSTGQKLLPQEPAYAKAVRMDAEGLSVRSIAIATGKPKSTISDWLRDARKAA